MELGTVKFVVLGDSMDFGLPVFRWHGSMQAHEFQDDLLTYKTGSDWPVQVWVD